MIFTEKQKTILSSIRMGKIFYRDMWKTQKRAGYTTRGDSRYHIHLAKDMPEDVKNLVILHEAGHIYLYHLEENFEEEFKTIKKIFEEKGKPLESIKQYGGLLSFLNICMDLEVNCKVFTRNNVKMMNTVASVLTPEFFGIPVLDTFRDYYEPLVDLIDPDREEKVKNKLERALGEPQFPDELKDIPIPIESSDSKIQQILDSEEKIKNEEEGSEGIDFEEYLRSIGTKALENYSFQQIEILENPSKKIKTFLEKIIGMDLQYLPDAIKLHNRGSRKNSSNILYSSRKRKIQKGKKKLAILVDVSFSMDIQSLVDAISTLKQNMSLLNNSSIVVLWSDRKVSEFPIQNTPKFIDSGGGTVLGEGLRYIINKGFTDCVIYSDFYTDDLDLMMKLIKKHKTNIYSIITVERKNENKEFSDFLKVNKDFISL